MSDVWHEPEHFEQAKKAIADNVGEGLFDYALNGAVSAGAFHMAYGKISRSEMLQKAARNAYMIAKDRTATTVPVRINEFLFENQTLPEDSPLRLLWEKTKDSVVRLDGMKPRRSSGGSGFFVSEDGLAVTNYHVIKEMKNPTVLTEQGQKFAVKLVARDKFNDLALVRVTNAPPGTVFSAASIDTAGGIGTPVAVIGYPGEFGAKVVEPGEVVGSSAWKRKLSTSPFLDLEPRANWYLRGLGKMGEQKHFYKPKRLERNASGIPYIRRENLQHSALATAGNSGSPVFDMNGKVIGIHSNGGGTSINARHLEAMLKQTQLTPPGDGWLDISSHLEPAGSSPSTPKILSAKVRDRWSLASSLRADLKATITAENRAQWRDLRVRRVRSSAAVAGIDARIHSLISPPKEDEPW
jgi:S1-C subfamily serine protease